MVLLLWTPLCSINIECAYIKLCPCKKTLNLYCHLNIVFEKINKVNHVNCDDLMLMYNIMLSGVWHG